MVKPLRGLYWDLTFTGPTAAREVQAVSSYLLSRGYLALTDLRAHSWSQLGPLYFQLIHGRPIPTDPLALKLFRYHKGLKDLYHDLSFSQADHVRAVSRWLLARALATREELSSHHDPATVYRALCHWPHQYLPADWP